MDIIFVALRLFTKLSEALKAYFEFKNLREEIDNHSDAQCSKNRPKHLKG